MDDTVELTIDEIKKIDSEAVDNTDDVAVDNTDDVADDIRILKCRVNELERMVYNLIRSN
jgi:hypothetical protein